MSPSKALPGNWSLRGVITAVALFASVGLFMLANSSAAGNASLSVVPSSVNAQGSSTVEVEIRADTDGEAVNAVDFTLTYDPTVLTFSSFDSSSSDFEIEAFQSTSSGSINMARGTTSAKTGDVLVTKITFQTVNTTGTSNLTFGSSVVARASDSTDILGVTNNGTVSVDNADPTVSITAPSANDKVNDSLTVTADANDNVGVDRVDFLVDGSVVSTDSSSPYLALVDTTGLSNASHTLTAVAYDAAGNSQSSSAVNVTVDNANPTVSVTNPSNNDIVRGSLTFSATASDNDSVTQVEFLVDGSVVNTDTSSPYSFTWNSASVSNGSHSLEARATDPAGNTQSSNITVTVDNANPSVSLTAPSGGSTVSNTVVLSASASDNQAVAQVEFLVDGSVVNTDTSSPFSFNWDSSSVSNANHNISARATDTAGNTATSSSITVTVDNSIPSDLNLDNKVDILDLSLLLSNWNSTTSGRWDINNSGKVDVLDLSILLSNWNVSI